jgi:PAS domain S-box-containing protein
MTLNDRADSQAEERNRQLAAIVSSSDDAILSNNLAGIVVTWNKGAQDLYGYTSEEMIGRSITTFIPEHLHEETRQFLRDIVAGQPVAHDETVRRRKDGSLVSVSLVISPIRDNEGRIIGASTIAHDITKRRRAEAASCEKEQILSASQRIAHIGSWSYDLSSRITWSEELFRIYGISPDTFTPTAESFTKLTVPEDRPAMQRWIAACVAGEKVGDLEFRTILPDGEIRFITVRGELQCDAENRPVRMAGTAQITTERKREEEVCERLAAVVESSDDAIIGSSLDGTITAWNSGAGRLFGYSSFEVMGKPIGILLPPERAREQSEILERIKRGERVYHFETVRVRKDGEKINVSVTISPIRDRSGAVVGASKIARDITERKFAEEQLRKSEERFSKAFRSCPLAISISTVEEGRYLDVNESFLQMVGYKREEMTGKIASELTFWARPSQRSDMLRQLHEKGRVTSFRTQYKTSAGEIREAELSAEQIELEGLHCVLTITRDITAAQLLEAQFLQAQKMEAVGRLAGGVAHDFNNILGVIIGYLDLSMVLVAPGSPLNRHLDQIKKASDHAVLLTRQLLAFSRQQVVFPKILNLNDVVRDVTNMLQRMVGEDVAISFRPATPIGSVRVDPGQIEQILMNLVVNARDAMPTGGNINIETDNAELDEHYVFQHVGARAGQYVVLAVSDTGCGMDEGIKSQIFEPFFTTKGVGQGTGLGLSTVYGIVKQNAGTIFVYSEPRKGTTFKIYLPRVAAQDQQAVPSHEEGELPGGCETILVVEDNGAMRELTVTLLRGAGYRVIEARDAETALDIFRASEPGVDLLLTDVIMPGKSGAELVKQARMIRPGLRSLMISGYTGDLVALRGGASLEAAFLEKPFTRSSLLTKVRSALLDGMTAA